MAKENHDQLIIAGVGLALLYFGLIKPITDKLGLTQSEKERALAEIAETASGSNGWNPNFYKDYTAKNRKWTILTSSAAQRIAKQLSAAWGTINDDEQAIYAAFRSLKNQLQLSQVSDTYSKTYKQDLLTRLKAPWYYLRDGLDANEFAEVAKIVNALPINS
jgi:hypothetical protein